MTKEECEIETSKAIMEMRSHIAELEKENAGLEKEKCELLGIIQGKDKVVQELKEKSAFYSLVKTAPKTKAVGFVQRNMKINALHKR